MLSHKSLVLLTFAALGLANKALAVGPECMKGKGLEVLLHNEEIWDDVAPTFTLHAKGGVPAGLPADVFADVAAWDTFHDNLTHTFATPACIKTVFNDKGNWENMYEPPMTQIVGKLLEDKRTELLDFGKLTDTSCRFLLRSAGAVLGVADYPQALKPNQFSNFRAGCWDAFSLTDFVRHWSTDLIRKIPPAAFNTPVASQFILENMAEGSSVLSKMTPAQMEAYVSDPERCKTLNEGALLRNLNKEVIKKYSNACLLKVKDWGVDISGDDAVKAKVQTLLKNLSTKAFTTLPPEGIHSSIAALIPASHVKEFDSAEGAEFRCANAPLAHLSLNALSGVTEECMAGWIANSAGPFYLGKKIAKLPGNIFSKIHPDDLDSFEKIMHVDNLKHFKAEHWATLLSNPLNCDKIQTPDDNNKVDWNRLPTITGACAAVMKPEVFKALLASKTAVKKFDEHILANAGTDLSVDSMEAVAKGRLELLRHVGTSTPVGSDHPCSQFSLDEYKDKDKKTIRNILDNSNRSCILSIKDIVDLEDEDASEDVFKGLPHTIFAALGVENLKAHKHLPKNFWTEMKPLVFEILATPANCAELDSTLLAQINTEALSALHYECLAYLKGDLTVAQVAKVPKTVFEQIDSTTLSKVKHLNGATNDQLAALSAKVADAKKHAGSAFTDALIAGLSAAQIGALNAGTVNALPDAAWKGFDAERFKALRPEVLTKVTCSKIKQVPVESLHVLTAAQAVRLGEGVTKAEDSPRCAFTKDVLAKMKDPEAVKIMSGASQLVVSMVLVAVSMVLGLWLA